MDAWMDAFSIKILPIGKGSLTHIHKNRKCPGKGGTDMLIAKQHRTPGQKADDVTGHVSTLYSR